MNGRLTEQWGPHAGLAHCVGEAAATVGREPTNIIVMADPRVSAQHARVWREGTRYVVEDMGSRNGTFVNGVRLTGPHQLTDGDVISLAGIAALSLLFALTATTVAVPRERLLWPERVLTTVLFTDIVRATAQVVTLGDQRWQQLLARHYALARHELGRWGGREVNTTGDGLIATFDHPVRAIGCAGAIRDAVQAVGLALRAGVHTGECERLGTDLSGVAVHITARVLALAGPGEILVTSTVKDLVTGAKVPFVDRGRRVLRGVHGAWRLYAMNEVDHPVMLPR
jgi:class 3 adenylate cyclase